MKRDDFQSLTPDIVPIFFWFLDQLILFKKKNKEKVPETLNMYSKGQTTSVAQLFYDITFTAHDIDELLMQFDRLGLCGRAVTFVARGISLLRVGYLVGCSVLFCSHLLCRFFPHTCVCACVHSSHRFRAKPFLLECFLHLLVSTSFSHFSCLCVTAPGFQKL